MVITSRYVFALLALVACSQNPATDNAETAKAIAKLPALIFIPGYYGSALKDKKTGARFFITATEYLFGSKSVSLFNEELQTPAAPDLEPDGILDSIRLIPFFYKVDVYGKFRDQLQDFSDDNKIQFIPFAYDWRADHLATVEKLAALILKLRKDGAPQVDIIAHSMGGLITTYYLAYGTQQPEVAKLDWSGAKNVDHVIFMATPFRGVFSTFRNMQRGAELGSNKAYLPAEAVASFPATYQLTDFENAQTVDSEGTRKKLYVGDLSLWSTHHLGLLRKQDLLPEIKERRLKFTQEQLVRAQKIYALRRIEPNDKLPPPPSLKIYNLVGVGHPTTARAFFQKSKDDFIFDTDHAEKLNLDENLLFDDGDATVVATSAQLPEALVSGAKIRVSKLTHDRIFEDPDFRKEYPAFIQSGRP